MTEPTIISFYSFRGGVGRSMAMLNTGLLLARAGRRVLLVDLDLEAPGLTGLADRTDLLPASASRPRSPGVVQLLLDYLRAPDTSVLGATEPASALAKDYLVPLAPPMPRNPFAKRGAMHLLPAGQWDAYEQQLAELRVGSPDFELVREPLARRLRFALSHAGDFDYVLVDARTGLSDEGYMAAKFLCRFLVVLSGLNEQNIAGTGLFLRHLAGWREQKKGPDRVVLVASPVCEYEDDAKAKRRRAAVNRLRKETGARLEFSLELPYHPRLSLFEELVAVNWPKSGLGLAYRRLAETLLSLAKDGFDDWSGRCLEALRGEPEVKAASDALRQCAALDRDRAVQLARQISGALGSIKGERAVQALPLFDLLGRIDRGEPLHPLVAARVARQAGRDPALHQRALKALDRAMALAQPRNWAAMAAIWTERAALHQDVADHGPAVAAVVEAAKLYEQHGEAKLAADMWLGAAGRLEELGEWAEARAHAEQATQIAQQQDDRALLARSLRQKAAIDRLTGDYAGARAGFEESLRIDREQGERSGVAVTLHSLAQLDRLAGDYAKARAGFEESLEIKRALGDRSGVAVTLHGLAELDRLAGDYAKACTGFEKSLEIFRALGDRPGIAVTELYLAAALAGTEPDSAIPRLRALLSAAEDLPDPHVRVRGRLLLGEALAGIKRWEEALVEFEATAAQAEEHGFRDLAADARAGAAECLAQLGREGASELARAALSWFREQAPRHPRAVRLRRMLRGRAGGGKRA